MAPFRPTSSAGSSWTRNEGRNERDGIDRMTAPGSVDPWGSGHGYEAYVGRWSRPIARDFLAWLALPAGLDWLDVGCGTGALTATVLSIAGPGSVVGIDPAGGFIDHARDAIVDPRARFLVGDARWLSLEDASVDVAISGLVLNFIPDPALAAAEMRRVVRPGGTVAAYVWDYADGMELIRRFWDAAVAEDPAAAGHDEGVRFPIAAPEPLLDLLRSSGLVSVETTALEVSTTFRDFDDYWTPFLGGQGPGPGYAMSLEPAARDRLRERVRGSLPVDADGSIRLVARAWAVRGRRA
jgi:SAM-dependent methyltransferase